MLRRSPTRIVVVDDHPVVHDGVAWQLRAYSDMVVVGHSITGAEAVTVCASRRPDVVLLDLRLPDCLAADVIPEVHRVSPQTRVLLFTAFLSTLLSHRHWLPGHVEFSSKMQGVPLCAMRSAASTTPARSGTLGPTRLALS